MHQKERETSTSELILLSVTKQEIITGNSKISFGFEHPSVVRKYQSSVRSLIDVRVANSVVM